MNSAIKYIRQTIEALSIETGLTIEDTKAEFLQYLDTPEEFDNFFIYPYSQLPECAKRVRVQTLISALLF
jgi:hypothetical protein